MPVQNSGQWSTKLTIECSLVQTYSCKCKWYIYTRPKLAHPQFLRKEDSCLNHLVYLEISMASSIGAGLLNPVENEGNPKGTKWLGTKTRSKRIIFIEYVCKEMVWLQEGANFLITWLRSWSVPLYYHSLGLSKIVSKQWFLYISVFSRNLVVQKAFIPLNLIGRVEVLPTLCYAFSTTLKAPDLCSRLCPYYCKGPYAI